jgi:hypothetical protein
MLQIFSASIEWPSFRRRNSHWLSILPCNSPQCGSSPSSGDRAMNVKYQTQSVARSAKEYVVRYYLFPDTLTGS